MVAVTFARAVGPDSFAAILNPGPALSTATTRDLGAEVALSDLRGLNREGPEPMPTTEAASGWFGWIGMFYGTVVISSILLGWRAARNRWRAARSHPAVRSSPTIVGPHFTNPLRASKSLGSRASRVQDLPPWLSGPS
jgi:hypothetical protein